VCTCSAIYTYHVLWAITTLASFPGWGLGTRLSLHLKPVHLAHHREVVKIWSTIHLRSILCIQVCGWFTTSATNQTVHNDKHNALLCLPLLERVGEVLGTIRSHQSDKNQVLFILWLLDLFVWESLSATSHLLWLSLTVSYAWKNDSHWLHTAGEQ